MLRSYLVSTAQKAAKRRVFTEKRERRQKELMESRLADVEQEHRQAQAGLMCQIQTLQQELKIAVQAGARLPKLEGDNESLVQEIEDLRARLSHDDECLTAAQKLAEAMDQQVQHVQTLHEAKIQQLEKDTHEQTVRSHENAEMRKRYETLKETYEKLRQNHETLKEKLIENENFLRTQEGKVAARFEKELAEARCKCAQAEADRDDFEANLETCKRQLQVTREQNATLRAYLDEGDDQNKENRDSSNAKHGFISNALGQARRTLQLGHYK